jgi:hypothetical protein
MRSASLGITEQAVKVPELMFRVHFGCVTKSPLHFTDIHRCIPPCSVSVTFASEESQWAWGLRHWASFPPLYPCGRLSRTLSRGSAFLRPQTTMPRLTPSRTSGFRSGCPCSTLHSPSHSLKVSRVHGIGPISGLLCGGVFISVSLPLFGAPHPRHRVGQVYLCSLPCVGLSDMGRVYSCQLGLQFR